MKLYIGTDISQDAVQRLTNRLTSEVKLPRNINMKQIISIYSIIANSPFSPKQISVLLKDITLKKIRTCIHLMLRYRMIRVYKNLPQSKKTYEN